MATADVPVSDMLVTVKSRELQRGMLVEMRGGRTDAARHLLGLPIWSWCWRTTVRELTNWTWPCAAA